MSEWFPSTSRRTVLAAGSASLAALAGCSALDGDGTDTETPTVVDRVVVRSDTGREEPIRVTLVHAGLDEDDDAERPVWTTVRAPADGEQAAVVQGLDLGPGFFSMTAVSERSGSHEVDAFKTTAADWGGTTRQYEVVIRETGDLWLGMGTAGRNVSVPGED